MGKVKGLKIRLTSADGEMKVDLNYSGSKEVLEEFQWAETRFHDLGLELTWLVVLRNISLLENQIWWQWNEMIEGEPSRQRQLEMVSKRSEYMRQARSLALSFGGNIYKGYDALAFSVYSKDKDFSTNYETVAIETEAPLAPSLVGETVGTVELKVGENTLACVTEQLRRFFKELEEEAE